MGHGQINGQAVRNQLEQVLSSAGFARNARLSGFLRFLVERHLEGRGAELKESLIAIQVFDRRPDYWPPQSAGRALGWRRWRANWHRTATKPPAWSPASGRAESALRCATLHRFFWLKASPFACPEQSRASS